MSGGFVGREKARTFAPVEIMGSGAAAAIEEIWWKVGVNTRRGNRQSSVRESPASPGARIPLVPNDENAGRRKRRAAAVRPFPAQPIVSSLPSMEVEQR